MIVRLAQKAGRKYDRETRYPGLSLVLKGTQYFYRVVHLRHLIHWSKHVLSTRAKRDGNCESRLEVRRRYDGRFIYKEFTSFRSNSIERIGSTNRFEAAASYEYELFQQWLQTNDLYVKYQSKSSRTSLDDYHRFAQSSSTARINILQQPQWNNQRHRRPRQPRQHWRTRQRRTRPRLQSLIGVNYWGYGIVRITPFREIHPLVIGMIPGQIFESTDTRPRLRSLKGVNYRGSGPISYHAYGR